MRGIIFLLIASLICLAAAEELRGRYVHTQQRAADTGSLECVQWFRGRCVKTIDSKKRTLDRIGAGLL